MRLRLMREGAKMWVKMNPERGHAVVVALGGKCIVSHVGMPARPLLARQVLMPHNGWPSSHSTYREDERYGARNTDTATSVWGRGRRNSRTGAGRLMALA